MQQIELTVNNESGLHSRPADLFVRTAKLYKSAITVRSGETSADAKNIVRVILLNVAQGMSVRIQADGPDEVEALEDLKTLVQSRFETINQLVGV